MKKILKVFLLIFASITLFACDEINFTNTVNNIHNKIEISLTDGDTNNSVTKDFSVTTLVNDIYVISWESNDDAITINDSNAIVIRDTEDILVDLTASFTFNEKTYKKVFSLTVLKQEIIQPTEPSLDDIKDGINITLSINDTFQSITNLILLTNNVLDHEISWTSSNSAIKIDETNSTGTVLRGEIDLEVTLTATFTFKNISYEKVFELKVLKEDFNEVNTYYQDFSSLIDFRNSNYPEPQSEYLDDYDIDINGINYDVINFRSDAGMHKNAKKSITIGGFGQSESEAGRGFIRANNVKDGINSFKFEARLPFSPESTYPQVNGKDKASNTIITLSIYQNGLLKDKEIFKFKDDKEANKGAIFEVNDLGIAGTVTFELDINSGHRATISFIQWQAYKAIDNELELITNIGFDRLNQLEYYSGQIELDNHLYNVNFMRSNYKDIHSQKELPFIEPSNHKDIARFKPAYDNPAYIYNEKHFVKVTKLEFMARNFGDWSYQHNGIIKVYYQLLGSDDWVLIEQEFDLTIDFNTFSVDINQENVRVKIEMVADNIDSNSTVNLDNIRFLK